MKTRAVLVTLALASIPAVLTAGPDATEFKPVLRTVTHDAVNISWEARTGSRGVRFRLYLHSDGTRRLLSEVAATPGLARYTVHEQLGDAEAFEIELSCLLSDGTEVFLGLLECRSLVSGFSGATLASQQGNVCDSAPPNPVMPSPNGSLRADSVARFGLEFTPSPEPPVPRS